MGRSKVNQAYGGGHLKIVSHQNLILVKTDVFDFKKQVKKAKTCPEPPKPTFLTKHKLEGVVLRRNRQGLRNAHFLYGPSWWQTKWLMEKGWGG